MIGSEEGIKPPKTHNVILEGRHTLSATGLEDVDRFDENTVAIFTPLGLLTVQGEQLHINKFSVETGELSLEGNIYGFSYADEQTQKHGGFFSKVFR